MDRDAIIAHGGMAFVKESYMERSDGAKFPVCVACGMIPIFNARLNISICPMCDGPVKYTGDNINNLELLPPLGRPKSRIVQMEIPYSTKLLTYEQETYLNLAMRYMTTSGFKRLAPLEFSGTSSEVVKTLQPMQLPQVVAPAYVEEKPAVSLTVEQLRSMGAHVNDLSQEERAKLDVIQDEGQIQLEAESQEQSEAAEAQMNAMANLQVGAPAPPQVWGDEAVMGPPLQNQVIMPVQGMPIQGMQQQPLQAPMMGGMVGGLPAPNLAGDGLIRGPSVPGMGPMIAVRTDADAFAQDGLMEMGGSRAIRRNYYRTPGPAVNRYTPQAGGNFLSALGGGPDGAPITQTVTVTKLE
jgi:hypothetical protein